MIRRRAAGQKISKASVFFASVLPRYRVLEHLLSASSLLALFFAFTFACPAFAGPEGGTVVWQARDWNGVAPTAGKQEATATAVDPSGNVIVAGYTDASGSDDYYTVKFDVDGNIVWRAIYNDANSKTDRVMAVTTASNGDVLVTGYAWNGTNYDIYTIKYTSAGDGGGNGVVSAGWPKTYNGSANGNDYPTAIAVDGNGFVYVAGYTQTSSGKDDYVLLKYASGGLPDTNFSSDGVETYGNADRNDRMTSIAVNNTGIAVTGYSENSSGNFDCLTIKYNLTGASPKIWEYRHDGGGRDDRGIVARMDTAGNVYMAGYTSNASDKDIHIAKLRASDGSAAPGAGWMQTYDGGYDDEPRDLLVDSANSLLYLTGYSLTLEGAGDFFTARYSSATGSLSGTGWPAIFNSANGNVDTAAGITVNSSGEVFVTGFTYDATSGNYDWQTVKYSGSGHFLWSKNYNWTNNKNDRPVGIGLSPTGEIYVAGWSDIWTAGASDYDFYVVKYAPGTLNRPTGLSAVTVTTARVDLAWERNSSDEDGFKIERCAGTTCDFSSLDAGFPVTVGNAVVSYQDSSVAADTVYNYRVRAYKGADYSYYSDKASATTTVLNPATPAWLFLYNGTATPPADEAASIAVGPDHHPVVTGFSKVGTSYDYYTVKINRTDKSVIWKGGYDNGSSENDKAVSATVDGDSHVLVTGFSRGAGSYNVATTKYDAAGNSGSAFSLWNGVARYDNGTPSSGDDYAVATTVDGSNNVIVVGYGSNTKAGPRTDNDIYVIKYPSTCASCPPAKTWSAVHDGVGEDRPSAVAVDSSGNIIVTGYTHNGTNYDYLTLKYSSGGSLLWGPKTYNGTGNGDDYARSVSLDAAGNVYITGLATNASGKTDFYTIKYSGSTGGVEWERSYGGSAVYDYEAVSVKVDPIEDDGDAGVVVAGTVESGANNHDFHVMKYGLTGNEKWHKTIQRPSTEDYVKAVGMDPSGNLCVAGNTSGNGGDILAVKLKYNGDILGSNIYNGGGNLEDKAIAATANKLGEIFVAGSATNAGNNFDYAVFMCEGSSMVVPAPFTATQVAAATNAQKINLNWTNTTLPSGVKFNVEKRNSTDGGAWAPIPALTDTTVTSYQDTGLLDGKEYCYRIMACSPGNCSDGGSVKSRNLGACIMSALTPPAGLFVYSVTTSAITLMWENIPGNDGYKVEWSPNGSTGWTSVGTTVQDFTTITHSSLSGGTTYYYRVSVHNSGGYSVVSSVKSGTTNTAAPTLNNPTAASDVQINLGWTDLTGETGYRVEWSPNGTSGWAQVGNDLNAGTTSTSHSALTPGTAYYYRMKALNIPASETTGTATAGSTTTTIQVAGNPWSVDQWKNHSVVITAGANNKNQVRKITNNSTNTLTVDIAYSVAITTDNTFKIVPYAGESSYSTPVKNTTTWLSKPTITSASAASTTQITVQWNDPNTLETGHKVDYSACTNSDPASCSNAGLSYWANWPGATKTITGANAGGTANTTIPASGSLESGRTYRIRVYATGTTNSDYSTAVTATTNLTAPGSFTATATTDTSIFLSWANVLGETGFTVQWDQGTSTWANYPTSPATLAANTATYTANNGDGSGSVIISEGHTYCFKITATNGGVSASAQTTQQCAATPISGTTMVSATAVSATQINVTWNAKAGAQRYRLERSLDNFSSVQKTYNLGAVTDYSDNNDGAGLSTGTLYYYRVKWSPDASGENFSSPSDIKNARTWPAMPALYTYSDGRSYAMSTAQIHLSWADVAGEDKYVVQQKGPLATGEDCTAVYAWSNLPGMPLAAGTTGVNTANTLSAGRKYCFQIRAYADAYAAQDTNRWSSAIPITTLLGPTTVTSVAASGLTVTASWSQVANNNGYLVQRSEDNKSSWQTVVSQTAADQTGLTESRSASKKCWYRVYTLNADIKPSSGSNEDKSASTQPATPTFRAESVAISDTRIQLSWNASAETTQYNIQYKATSSGTWLGPVSPNPLTSTIYTFAVNTFSPNTQYDFQINAQNTAGTSAWGPTPTPRQIYTLMTPPTLSVSSIAATSITISWTTAAGNTGIKIERSPDGSTGWTSPYSSGSNYTPTSFTDSPLAEGTYYCYRISVENAVNVLSGTSNVVCATTKPKAPPSFTANVVSQSEVDLTWQVVYGATNYKIERKTGVNGTWGQIANPAVAYLPQKYCGYYNYPTVSCPTLIDRFTFYQDTNGLAGDTEYCYQVKAWHDDAAGDSAPSATVCVKTPALGVPVLAPLTFPGSSSRKVKLDWTYDPAGGPTPDGFAIESQAWNGNWVTKTTVSRTEAANGTNTYTYTDTVGIQPNTAYKYRIRAVKTYSEINFVNGLDPAVWSQAGYIYNGNPVSSDTEAPIAISDASLGSTSITTPNGTVRFDNSATLTGTAGQSNYSQIVLVSPGIIRGDFDIQLDYALPNNQITDAGGAVNHDYVRLRVQMDSSNNNFVFAGRNVNGSTNRYWGRVKVDGAAYDFYYNLTSAENAGKLRVTRTGSALSAYAWTGGAWKLLGSKTSTYLPLDAYEAKILQFATQQRAVTLAAEIDNLLMKSDVSAPSNERSDTSPAWELGDDTCN